MLLVCMDGVLTGMEGGSDYVGPRHKARQTSHGRSYLILYSIGCTHVGILLALPEGSFPL